jgi:hypothetical protein
MLCLFMLGIFIAPAVSGLRAQAAPQQVAPPKDAPAAKASPSPNPATPSQEAVPGPRTPKERMGVYVFMAWLWVAIIVLVFILRAKVREADRLFETGYFREKPPES